MSRETCPTAPSHVLVAPQKWLTGWSPNSPSIWRAAPPLRLWLKRTQHASGTAGVLWLWCRLRQGCAIAP
jgi:hypothetical protein